MIDLDEKTIREAWDRIARTPDGQVIYADLQRALCGYINELDAPDGALRANNERARYAAEKIALMAKGIDESAGRSARFNLIVFRSTGGVDLSRRVTARDAFRAADAASRPAGGNGQSAGSDT